jgi:hypothetical protein
MIIKGRRAHLDPVYDRCGVHCPELPRFFLRKTDDRRPSAEDTSAFAAIGQPPSVESYFPLSAADRFVVGIAAPSELSFETGVPLLANPGGGRGVEVAWEGSVDGATGVPLCPSPVLDSL